MSDVFVVPMILGIVVTFFYYAIILFQLIDGSYDNKRDFIFDLIPYGWVIRKARENFKNLN